MYSKEHIKPKLHQLDQDKLARLYADLRRESLATGSFPITVRHLESMIRMSEASAKMHLREYVRSDDIDLAIQVTVGSFVNAQKMSIKKTLERVSVYRTCRPQDRMYKLTTQGFRKYVHQATDNESNYTDIKEVPTLNQSELQSNSSKRGLKSWRFMMWDRF
jgi:DNA replication licensing factor MCM2